MLAPALPSHTPLLVTLTLSPESPRQCGAARDFRISMRHTVLEQLVKMLSILASAALAATSGNSWSFMVMGDWGGAETVRIKTTQVTRRRIYLLPASEREEEVLALSVLPIEKKFLQFLY